MARVPWMTADSELTPGLQAIFQSVEKMSLNRQLAAIMPARRNQVKEGSPTLSGTLL